MQPPEAKKQRECLCTVKSNCSGPRGAGRDPAAWRGAARRAAEDGDVSKGHRQAAARHSGGSAQAGKPALPRRQDF